MQPEDKYFNQLTPEELWKRYCGFLDLDMRSFMAIQEELLLDQLDRVWPSTIGKAILGKQKPRSIQEFQRLVPLTTYDNYAEYLKDQREDALAFKPAFWCHSSGRMGEFKWFPHSPEFVERANKACVSIVTLASTDHRGKVSIGPGFRFLLSLPPAPYMSGAMIDSMGEYLSFRPIPPRGEFAGAPLQERVARGFQIALKDGVDVIGAIASVLVKMGEQFEAQARNTRLSPAMLHPTVLSRLVRAKLRARAERRPMLPKDLWPTKAIVTSGMDTAIYKEAITRYWGSDPSEFYACAESLILATQGWNRNGMYFFPDIAFYEFIPEMEVRKWQDDHSYEPRTVLYNEVQEGELYEVVISQFFGMPLLRYRMHDLVKFTGLEDKETGVRLPHIQFQRRVGETIDLAALARLDERTLWQAIADSGIRYTDWVATKEYEAGQTYLRLLIEVKDGSTPEQVAGLVDQNLKLIDVDYRDIESYLGMQPVRVTVLPPGTFQRYTERQRQAGADLAHLKPPHVNASVDVLHALHELSQAP